VESKKKKIKSRERESKYEEMHNMYKKQNNIIFTCLVCVGSFDDLIELVLQLPFQDSFYSLIFSLILLFCQDLHQKKRKKREKKERYIYMFNILRTNPFRIFVIVVVFIFIQININVNIFFT